jgi:acyl carrier protein
MTMQPDSSTIEVVKVLIIETLGLTIRPESMTAKTALLNSIPELDSMAIVSLMGALETKFQIKLEDDDISGEVFETVESLASLVERKLAEGSKS